uniref:Uncharacterized protein n=1 Tax=Acrobeloides nanus TaxID=290746 RepID=A0A914DSA8_9BILA
MKNISVITKLFDFENLYITDFEIASIYIIQHPEILHIPRAKSISLGGNIVKKAFKVVEFFVQYETVLYWNDSLERAGLTKNITVIDNPYNAWEFYDLNKDEWTLRIMHSSDDRYFWKIRMLNGDNSY